MDEQHTIDLPCGHQTPAVHDEGEKPYTCASCGRQFIILIQRPRSFVVYAQEIERPRLEHRGHRGLIGLVPGCPACEAAKTDLSGLR